MKWSHRSETHLDKLQTSDFLITDRTIWEMNTQPWARLSLFQLTFWGKPDSTVISTLDLFWKHTRVSRQNHNILCSLLPGSPFSEQQQLSWKDQRGTLVSKSAPRVGLKDTPVKSAGSGRQRSALIQGVGGKILKINKPEKINGQETILGDTKKLQP